jgi:hypothetical protein
MAVGVGQDANLPVGGAMWPAVGSQHSRIAGRTQRRIEGQPAHMFGHDERGHGFEHRHLNRLPLAGALALQECGHHRIDHREVDGLVANQGRHKPQPRCRSPPPTRQTARSLDDVVECRTVGKRPVLTIAMSGTVDEPRIDGVQPIISEAEPQDRLASHVVHEDVAPPHQRQQNLGCGPGRVCIIPGARGR